MPELGIELYRAARTLWPCEGECSPPSQQSRLSGCSLVALTLEGILAFLGSLCFRGSALVMIML